jgi:hypothetical protein
MASALRLTSRRPGTRHEIGGQAGAWAEATVTAAAADEVFGEAWPAMTS